MDMEKKVVEKIQSFLRELGKKKGLKGLVELRTLLNLAVIKQYGFLEKAEQNVSEDYRAKIETAHMKVGEFAASISVTPEQFITYNNSPSWNNSLVRLIECYATDLLKPEN